MCSLPTDQSSMEIYWRSGEDKDAYENARIGRVFNHRRPDRYPLAVVFIRTEEEVIAAVKLAKQHNARVSIRSGGHSWAAWSVRENAILIDLGKFNDIAYDEETGVVRASPSSQGAQVNRFLESKGRLLCGGHCPDVGLGGFLLQGGMGWNCKNWGWACEQLVAIDAVTADGTLVRADDNQNTDLFYAARGAGPGFPAIVTRFHIRTRPRPKIMRVTLYVYPLERYRESFQWALDISPTFDTDTEIAFITTHTDMVPDHDEPVVYVSFLTWKDDHESAVAAHQSLRETRPSGALLELFCKETNLDEQYAAQSAANPNGAQYTCDNAWIPNDETDIPGLLEEAFCTLPSRETFSLWIAMAPCSRRELPPMALSLQTDHYFALYAITKGDSDHTKASQWTRAVMKNIEARTCGSYLGDSDMQVRDVAFWSEHAGKRLMDIRKKWNPDGRICGYLNTGDDSGNAGLANINKWGKL